MCYKFMGKEIGCLNRPAAAAAYLLHDARTDGRTDGEEAIDFFSFQGPSAVSPSGLGCGMAAEVCNLFVSVRVRPFLGVTKLSNGGMDVMSALLICSHARANFISIRH